MAKHTMQRYRHVTIVLGIIFSSYPNETNVGAHIIEHSREMYNSEVMPRALTYKKH